MRRRAGAATQAVEPSRFGPGLRDDSHAPVVHRLGALRPGGHSRAGRRQTDSGARLVSTEPEFPKTPFLSPRNVPFWAGLVMVGIVAGIVLWLH